MEERCQALSREREQLLLSKDRLQTQERNLHQSHLMLTHKVNPLLVSTMYNPFMADVAGIFQRNDKQREYEDLVRRWERQEQLQQRRVDFDERERTLLDSKASFQRREEPLRREQQQLEDAKRRLLMTSEQEEARAMEELNDVTRDEEGLRLQHKAVTDLERKDIVRFEKNECLLFQIDS